MEPVPIKNEAEEFYSEVLSRIKKAHIPFLIGGTYAVKKYTGIQRETKDMDCFCKVGDYMKILHVLSEAGHETTVRDERWLAKASKGKYFVDFIFGSVEGSRQVTDRWFDKAPTANVFRVKVKLTAPEELIASKALRQARDHFDGADINHLILKTGKTLDWNRLLELMDPHWEVLLSFLLIFRFVYPSEREIVPKWLMDELLSRIDQQFKVGQAYEKVCRGPLLSWPEYQIDLKEWGFQGPNQWKPKRNGSKP